jgi:hypothetical protein
MSDPKESPAPGVAKAPPGDLDEAAAECKVTPLESALEKWEKYFTPEEQAALRAYEAEQGPVE